MKKKRTLLFILCLFLLSLRINAQSGFVPEREAGFLLQTRRCVILDGTILCRQSFDAVAYTDYHSRIETILSPFLIRQEAHKADLLLPGVYIRTFGIKEFIYQHSDPGLESERPNAERAYFDQTSGQPSADSPSMRGMKGRAGLLYIGIELYKGVKNDHHWGGE